VIVVDSNVLAARNLTGIPTRVAERVEERDPLWIAPPLWRYEFQNILAKAIRARQLTPETAVVAWRKTSTQMVDNEHEPSPEKVIELSGRHRITGYDANFIALAMEMDVLCVTEDGELHRKFPGIAVSMEDFVKRDTGGNIVRETKGTYGTQRKRND
jgi:predicted nucleic acid-binding protein